MLSIRSPIARRGTVVVVGPEKCTEPTWGPATRPFLPPGQPIHPPRSSHSFHAPERIPPGPAGAFQCADNQGGGGNDEELDPWLQGGRPHSWARAVRRCAVGR